MISLADMMKSNLHLAKNLPKESIDILRLSGLNHKLSKNRSSHIQTNKSIDEKLEESEIDINKSGRKSNILDKSKGSELKLKIDQLRQATQIEKERR